MHESTHQILSYHQILGVKGELTHEELKKRYREKAKQLHPDRNPGQASHEKFVLLYQAYVYFEKKIHETESEIQPPPFDVKKYPSSYNKETWRYAERKLARERAAARKKMKEAHFENLGYFKILDKLFLAADIILFIVAIFLLLPFPILMFIHEGFLGLIISLIVQGVTYPLWTRAIKRFIPIH